VPLTAEQAVRKDIEKRTVTARTATGGPT
jgi:hypothetical protein